MKRIDISLRALKDPPEGWVEPPKKDRRPGKGGPSGRRPGGRPQRKQFSR